MGLSGALKAEWFSVSRRNQKERRRCARVVAVLALTLSTWAAAKSSDAEVAASKSAPIAQNVQQPGANPQAKLAPVPADLSALLLGMRSASGVVAHFTETKELALLTAPLEATGVVYFVPPARLVRVISSPGRSRLVVDGDQVRFEDEGVHRALDLSSSPIARQMIDSFVVLFNGDEKRLKELYTADYQAGVGTWSLHLVPRSMPLSRMISAFHLFGTGARIDRIESVEPDGDRTVTRFGETDVDHRFSAEDVARLFAAPPAS